MKPYGKKYIGGVCGHADRCGEEAPRKRTTDEHNRTLKRRERANGKREAVVANDEEE